MMDGKKHHAHIYLTLIALAILVFGGSGSGVSAGQTSRVGLVVRFDGDTYITRCITFNDAEINGYQVLLRSGLEIVESGGAICGIEDTGCPADECFCAMPDYWSYWHLIDGTWQYAASSAAGHTVYDGDVEGWSWESGEQPPAISFQQICSPSKIYLPIIIV